MLQFLMGPLLSFLGGPVIKGLISAYQAKLASQNTTEAHAIDLAKSDIDAQIKAREEAVALSGGRLSSIIQSLFALPIIIYEFKVIVWDKVLGWGTTDPITGPVGQWVSMIIGFYFGGKILSGVAGVVAKRLSK